ncbi:hypothetical protein D3C85_781980 [compost metagenome]
MMLSLWARSLATRESIAEYLALRLACRLVIRASRESCCFFKSLRLSLRLAERAANTPVLLWAKLSVADFMRASKPVSPVKIPLMSAALVSAAASNTLSLIDNNPVFWSVWTPNCASDFN